MTTTRLEAFSDGVIAIIITIMVLEIKVPEGTSLSSLKPLWPVFLSYVISFLFVGIYWGNHHHLLHTIHKINSRIMLCNLHLLFWLSLVPFATGWMGENHFAPTTIVVYSIIAILCGVAYALLQRTILQVNKALTRLSTALRRQGKKAAISLSMDAFAIPFAFVHPYISCALLILQSTIWLIPDREVEKAIESESHD